ncbi:conserved protein, unknown function [Hepatocystis sp. ex Piliocolobus tephrosceles]|nr:conserved protein, unknown function [Hepatocystis sp. ex Piliocolobus tephrosceles]
MNVEDKFKLIKAKYKEIKEQNDILKKAILEYKKDIKELERKNDEQNNTIHLLLDKNNNLINNNNELSNKVTLLSNSLEEQKKNYGWRNLMLLSKGSKDNVCESVALEELENKIIENENLHKKIDELESENKKLQNENEQIQKQNKQIKNKNEQLYNRNEKLKREIDNFNNMHQDKIKETEKSIEKLNDIIKRSNEIIINAENEKNEIKNKIEINKKVYNDTIELKNTQINKIKEICTILKNKLYPKYKINFDQTPYLREQNHYDCYIQNKLEEQKKYLADTISSIILKFIEYLTVCKELFIVQENQLNIVHNKLQTEKKKEELCDFKIMALKNISQRQVKCLESSINLLTEFKKEWEKNEDNRHIKNIIHNLSDQIKKFFMNTGVYLCVEEFLFTTNLNSTKFTLKNVIKELRKIKDTFLKALSLFTCLLFFCPYNNDKIINKYFEERSILKEKKNIEGSKEIKEIAYNIKASYNALNIYGLGEQRTSSYIYNTCYVESGEDKHLYDVNSNIYDINSNIYDINYNMYDINEYNNTNYSDVKKTDNELITIINESNFKKILLEREKACLGKKKYLTNYTDRNNRIIIFLLKKIKIILIHICESFKYIKSYTSFRICEIKSANILHIDTPKLITTIYELSNTFINIIENYDSSKIKLQLTLLLSYTNYNNCILYEQQTKHLSHINKIYNKKKTIPYNILYKNHKKKLFYKKKYECFKRIMLKKKKKIRKLKRVNRKILDELEKTVMENGELKVTTTFLKNSSEHNKNVSNIQPNVKDQEISTEADTNDYIKTYAEKVLNFIVYDKYNKQIINVKQEQLIEAYICSCIKITNLNKEMTKNKEVTNHSFYIYWLS